MPTRYERLRVAVSILAGPSCHQVAFLDELHATLTGSEAAAASLNDELALGLDDVFHAASDMISHGELSGAEAALILPLDDLLTSLSGEHNADFWRREALDEDSRWDDVRALAQNVLAGLPDEKRAVGRSGSNGS